MSATTLPNIRQVHRTGAAPSGVSPPGMHTVKKAREELNKEQSGGGSTLRKSGNHKGTPWTKIIRQQSIESSECTSQAKTKKRKAEQAADAKAEEVRAL